MASGTVELRSGDGRVVLVPRLGGKISEITLGGRQWLWHNPDVPVAARAEGAPFSLATDCGGYDDCFPTLAECLIPTWVQVVRSRQLPEHGELWSQPPEFSLTADENGSSATCRWEGIALAYQFTRSIAVQPDGSAVFTYEVHNSGGNRLPFVWASFPLLPLTATTRIALPEGARARLWTQHGVDLGRAGSEHRWPRLRVGSSLVDLSRPARAMREDFACRLFVDLGRDLPVVSVEEGNDCLEIEVHAPWPVRCGVWINHRGFPAATGTRWSLLGGRGNRPPMHVAIGPCIGTPDSLAEALGGWDDAQWIEPGGYATWTMIWRARRKEPEEGG